jgi:hypothetical protein
MTSPVTSAPSSPRHAAAASSQQPAASHVDPSLKRPASPASHELEGLTKRLATGLKFSGATSSPPRSSGPSAATASSHKRAAPDSDVTEPSAKRANTHQTPVAKKPVSSYLELLPSDITRRVAESLSTTDCVALVSANPQTLRALPGEKLRDVNIGVLMNQAAAVVTLADFHAVLGTGPIHLLAGQTARSLRNLPHDAWAQPLEVLAHRVKTFSNPNDFVSAGAAIEQAVAELNATDLPRGLVPSEFNRLAKKITKAVEQIREARIHTDGSLAESIENNPRLKNVMKAECRTLFGTARASAESELKNNLHTKEYSVATTARKFGIFEPNTLQELELTAINAWAKPETSRHRNAESHYLEAAQSLGVTTPEGIIRVAEAVMDVWLRTDTAKEKLCHLENQDFSALAAELGIDTPELVKKFEEKAINALEAWALPEALAAVVENVSVADIARQFNIKDKHRLIVLEDAAIQKYGTSKLEAGMSIPQVAQELGIQDSQSIKSLENSAIGYRASDRIFGGYGMYERHPSVAKVKLDEGKNVPQIASALGITSEEGLLQLQKMAVARKAESLLEAGSTVSQVAQALGVDPSLKSLHRAAHDVAKTMINSGTGLQQTIEILGITDEYSLDNMEEQVAGSWYDTKEYKAINEKLKNGGSATQLAAELEINRLSGIFKMEARSIDIYKPKIRPDDKASELATKLGISSNQGLVTLECVLIDEYVGGKIRVGQNVAQVAQQHGITTEEGLRRLESFAMAPFAQGLRQLNAGGSVGAITERQGIQNTYTVKQMEFTAMKSPAVRARLLENHESVVSVVRSLDIKQLKSIQHLETLVIAELAFDAIAKGMSAKEFAQKHGIVTLNGKQQLASVARSVLATNAVVPDASAMEAEPAAQPAPDEEVWLTQIAVPPENDRPGCGMQ